MVDKNLDSDLPVQNIPEETSLFDRGAEVEVRNEEDGAWFPATIVEFPPPNSSSKKRKHALVQYKSLVADHESSPFTERVDPNLIRPSPPKETESRLRVFEENDTVDACYRDGWRNGTVCKVLEGSRYRLYFDKPPDLVEFDGKDLRVHLDWVNGKWVRPQKQRSTGSLFSSGTSVEVHLAKENAMDAWYPALVIKENENDTFLVKYQDSMCNDELGKERVIVDSFHIRPAPPHHADRNYKLLDKVEFQYGSCWQTGAITEVLSERRYRVCSSQGKEERELNQSEIRPHLEWIDGKWIRKEAMNVSNQGLSGFARKGSDNVENDAQLEAEYVIKYTIPCSTVIKYPTEHSADFSENLPSDAFSNNNITVEAFNGNSKVQRKPKMLTVGVVGGPFTQLKTVPVKNSSKQELSEFSIQTTGGKRSKYSRKRVVSEHTSINTESPLAGKKADCQKVILVTRKGRTIKLPNRGPPESAAVKLRNAAQDVNKDEDKVREEETPVIKGLQANIMEESHCQTPVEKRWKSSTHYAGADKIKDLDQQTVGRNSKKRKRGRPRKLVAAIPKEAEAEIKCVTTEDFETECRVKENDLAITVISKNVVDDDQPLSMWFGGMHTPVSRDSDRQLDVSMEGSANDTKSSSMPESNMCLSFVKKSSIWKTIEDMEPFQIFPQKPHFHPLAECREEYREGSAIGIMVTFTSLFERISSLQFDDPRNIFESAMETLLDLERHGFDVAMLKGRVSYLLSIKESQGELLNESTDTDRQIREHTAEKQILLENINCIEKKITELQEELVASKSKAEAKDIEISKLRSQLEATNDQISTARYDFRSIAAAPWKYA
ncbi:hypothetical protein K2173_008142 [Erythroxylum novogranatense]|uniref:Agenet domain-containing protein n=1 Tax=Erythroxylum novogranatense TaxID=1862640 RepID=A0AAV8S993_9ROSI|nr:hypothetical protein K2173_008142 [Erythroxylum novogranatense]